MKKLTMVLILCWSAAAGAVPSTINFTGRLSTSAGPVNGAVNLTLKLYDVASGGEPLWTEIHSNAGADNGMVFLDAGTLTTLNESVFNGDRLYLEIVVNTDTLAPRLAINSVPYAMRTAAATSADFLGTSIGPGDVVTAVNPGGGIAATRTGNAVAVSLSTTGCTNGQVHKFNGTAFACAPDLNTTYTAGAGIAVTGTTISLATTGCAAGSVWKFNGTAFACAPDADTIPIAGTGIAVNGAAISLATTGCAAGSVWKFNGTTFACSPDLNTTYTGGTGIAVTGTTISLATTGCAAGSVWKFNGTAFACAPDATTTVTGTAPIAVSATNAISLASTGCASGGVLAWNGSAWACTVHETSGSCTWAVASVAAATLAAACPAGKHAVTGGCDAGTGGGNLLSGHPSGATAAPVNGALGSTVTQWSCQFSTATAHTAYALCCAQ